jgi:acetylornithine deacetylase/succinyl-diaminopimelate desuccinylase-like protein
MLRSLEDSEDSELNTAGGTETSELLQSLIRNACVNDGTPDSGGEIRNASTLGDYFGSGVDTEIYESAPGRGSIVARIAGPDRSAPTLCMLGHLDVVPANADAWQHDPFAAEIVGQWLWGRGAIDMLNLTSAMAVAFRKIALDVRNGLTLPKGTLIFAGVADEEANGVYGTEWLLKNAAEAVRADYTITESGGLLVEHNGAEFLTIAVSEKGGVACTLRIPGTAGHGSAPFRTDNALVNAARVIERIAESIGPATIDDTWLSFVRATQTEDLARILSDATSLNQWCQETDDRQFANEVHARTHLTIAPTVLRTGAKTNVIPDLVELELDVRTLPGQNDADVRQALIDALGDLATRVEIVIGPHDDASRSPAGTPAFRALERASAKHYPRARLLPTMSRGATDARFYRWRGSVAYGYGLFSREMSVPMYRQMFHAANERVDLESLALSTSCFEAIGREVVAGAM